MSATPIEYSSSDASAPVLDGQNGSLLTVLRAIGVTGYGAKAAAGWTEPYAAAGNIASFRFDHTVGNGCYLNVIDNGSTAATGKTAVVRMYQTMSALSTGTNPFPSVAQEASGLFVRKSETANSTARAWWALACRKWIYLFIQSNNEGGLWAAPYFFGDFKSIRAGDACNTMISAGDIVDPTTAQNRSKLFVNGQTFGGAPSGTNQRNYVAGAYTQVAASHLVAICNLINTSTVGGSAAPAPYPSLGNGAQCSPLLVMDSANNQRGVMPNVGASWHNQALTDLSPLTDLPILGVTGVSKRFSASAAGSVPGEVFFDKTSVG